MPTPMFIHPPTHSTHTHPATSLMQKGSTKMHVLQSNHHTSSSNAVRSSIIPSPRSKEDLRKVRGGTGQGRRDGGMEGRLRVRVRVRE